MSREQRLLYEQLKASEERYRELVENANSIILRWNQEGIITFFNEYAQQFFGFSADEIIGRHVIGSIVPEDESTGRDLRPLMDDICKNPDKYRLNINENIKKNGERCWISWTNKILLNDAGQPVGALSIGSDITQQRLLEEELRQAQKMQAIGQLAGGISHDFNNLIHGIIGYAEIIGQLTHQPEVAKHAQLIVNTASSAANLTHQLMTFARKGRYEFKPCNLHQLIEETVTIVRHTFPRNIRVQLDLQAERSWFNGNANQIKNALLNLALNARDALPEGGTLRLETALVYAEQPRQSGEFELADGNYLRLRVEDDGIGMDESVVSHIFEPFFTTKGISAGAGLGMGLASTYGAMHLHKGAISCISEPGRGSLFELLLPCCEAPGDTSAPPLPQRLPGMSLLVVDDEDMVLTYSRQLFSLHGHSVATANHADAAIAYYRQHWADIDLVILDMLMPDMDGHQLFLALRTINPNLRAIIASGYTNEARIEAALADGVCGYVKKPFTYDALQAKLLELFAPD